MPCDLDPDQNRQLASIIQPAGTFKRGEHIYCMGSLFSSLFIVQSGAVKTQQITFEGTANVTGFYLEGEVFGLDAIGSTAYPSEAVAVKRTNLCELPFDKFENICASIPKIQHWLLSRLGEQLKTQETAGSWTTRKKIEMRVLCFFLYLHRRMAGRDNPETGYISLPANKCDIALYLKTTPETFSRTLNVLRAEKLLDIRAGQFRFPDYDAVKRLVGE